MPQTDTISQWVNDMVASTDAFDVASTDHTVQFLLYGRDSRVKFNRVEGGRLGDKAEILITLANRQAAGLSVAGQYTPASVTQHASGDFQDAIYEFALYRNFLVLDHVQEKRIIGAMGRQPSKGYDLLKTETDAMFNGFYDDVEVDINGSSVHSATPVMGIWYPLSTSNSPGGLSQSTFTGWASNVSTLSGSSFNVNYIYDAILDAKRDTVMRGMETADLALLDQRTGAKLFRALIDAEDGGERTATGDDFAKVGRMKINVLGAWCFPITAPTSGHIGVFSTQSYLWVGDAMPENFNPNGPAVAPGGSTKTWTYHYTCSLMNGSPARSALIQGLVAT